MSGLIEIIYGSYAEPALTKDGRGERPMIDSVHLEEIISLCMDAAIERLMDVRLHKAENVAGCIFTKGSQAQTDVDIAAIKALKEESK